MSPDVFVTYLPGRSNPFSRRCSRASSKESNRSESLRRGTNVREASFHEMPNSRCIAGRATAKSVGWALAASNFARGILSRANSRLTVVNRRVSNLGNKSGRLSRRSQAARITSYAPRIHKCESVKRSVSFKDSSKEPRSSLDRPRKMASSRTNLASS